MNSGIWSRRGFLRSLSRSALVLSLEDVFRLGAIGEAPYQAAAQSAYNATPMLRQR